MNKINSSISRSSILATSFCAIILTGLSLAHSGQAQTIIPVSNSSFEEPFNGTAYGNTYTGAGDSVVPGWTLGNTFGSVDNVSSLFTAGLSGSYAIYTGGSLAQTTSFSFVAGETYTITLDVGRPTASTGSYGMTFGFRNAANDGFLGFEGDGFQSVDGGTITPGTFQTFSALYTALDSDAGNSVVLGLTDYYSGNNSQYIDNVTASTTAVPEPSTYFFMIVGIAGLAIFNRRRISTYVARN